MKNVTLVLSFVLIGIVIFGAVSLKNLHSQEIADAQLIEACGDQPTLLCEYVLDLTDSDVAAQASDWIISAPLEILLIVVLAIAINRLLHAAVRRFAASMIPDEEEKRRGRRRTEEGKLVHDEPHLLRATARAETFSTLLRSVSTVAVYSIAGVMVLDEVGLAIGPLIAGAGIIGIAIGFGSQRLVSDFLLGLFMLVEDQYGVGDIIDTGFCVGQVEAVSLRTTRVRDIKGTLWHVPNGQINRIGNMSQEWARTLLDLDVAYASDLDQVRSVIESVFKGMWDDSDWRRVLMERPEIWGVENFGADGITLRIVVKTEPAEQWRVGRELRLRLKNAFDAAGIEIPFPQRAVWVRREPGSSRDHPMDFDDGSDAGDGADAGPESG